MDFGVGKELETIRKNKGQEWEKIISKDFTRSVILA